MINFTKRICAGILALSIATLPAINYCSLNSNVYAVDGSAATEEDIYAFPDELPTAVIPAGLADGEYTVPVYMYTRYTDEASMGNGAIGHEAVLTVENGEYTAHLTFHDMPFLDLYGHLEKLWYYDTEGIDHEVTVEESEWLYDEASKDRVNTIRKCAFVLPENSAETKCRVKVDAMGDTEQDARIVFDFSSLAEAESVSSVDTTALEAKLAEAKAISNDDGKYTEESYSALQQYIAIGEPAVTADDLTQELADQLVTLIQGAIDGLVAAETKNAVDTTALEAKLAEAKAISNDDGKYTEESYSALQQYIAIGEPAVTADDLTQELADQLVTLIQDAIDGLIENTVSETTSTMTPETTTTETTTTETTTTESTTVPSREDGIYTANVKFMELESVLENGYFVHKPTNKENDTIKEIYGNTIKLTIENNNYTASLTSNGSENSDYYYGVILVHADEGSSPVPTYENTGTVMHDGEKYTTLLDGTVISFEVRDPSYIEFLQYLYNKETDETKIVNTQMVVDYDSLVKIGEVNIDKSELQYEIEFAEYIIESEASKYTSDSILTYQFYLDKAKEVYKSDSVTQAQVREAAENLKSAWEACEPVSETTTTTEGTTTTEETTTTTKKTTTTTEKTTTTTEETTTTTKETTTTTEETTTTTEKTTTTTKETTTTTEETTTAKTENIASNDDLCKWAINDCKNKTGVTPSNAAITDTSDDGKYTITLTDDEGNVLDTYVIDPKTGIGTNSANEKVNLPQTGNNSLSSLTLALAALAMTGIGMATVAGSDVLKRKKKMNDCC